jgi:hypothetical protein
MKNNLPSSAYSAMTVGWFAASGSRWWHAAGWECLRKGPRLFSCWPAYKNSTKPSVATYKFICNDQPDASFHQSLPTMVPPRRFHLPVSTRNHLTLALEAKQLYAMSPSLWNETVNPILVCTSAFQAAKCMSAYLPRFCIGPSFYDFRTGKISVCFPKTGTLYSRDASPKGHYYLHIIQKFTLVHGIKIQGTS